jgi:hypothetical protein
MIFEDVYYANKGIEAGVNEFNNLGRKVLDFFPDQGHTHAEGFHDSGDTQPSGSEVLTGKDDLNAAGVSDTPVAEKEAVNIIDGMFQSGGGMLGTAVNKTNAMNIFIYNTSQAVDKAREVGENYESEINPSQKDTSVVSREWEFGGHKMTTRQEISRETYKKNEEQ